MRSFREVWLRLGQKHIPWAEVAPMDEAFEPFWWVFYGFIREFSLTTFDCFRLLCALRMACNVLNHDDARYFYFYPRSSATEGSPILLHVAQACCGLRFDDEGEQTRLA